MPHPHSLFLLADHHHHPDGSLEESQHDAVASRQGEIAGREPVVQAATPDGASGEQISLALKAFGAEAWSGMSESFIWPLHLPLTSIGEPPDPPPPRSLHAIT